MPTFELSYGHRQVEVRVPAVGRLDVLTPRRLEQPPDEAALVRSALDQPIESPRLRDLARSGQRVVIVTSDLTRPCPSDRLLPPLLTELKAAGVPGDDITIIIALGLHRPMTRAELEAAVGSEVYQRVHVINHDPSDVVRLGVTSRGTPVEIARPVVEADVRVCVGNLELHYFAGYSGGAARSTVQANHAGGNPPYCHLLFHHCPETKGPTMTDAQYDVTVIGAGPGGYVAAIRAAQLGLKVALVERERLGGVCLNWGCIPTKALLRNAEVISLLGQGKGFGFTLTGLEVDFGAAVDRSRKVAERLVKGVGALVRKNKVEVIAGAGRLKAANSVEVALNQGGARTLQTRNVIIATGGRARSIPGIAPDGERVMTYREAIVLRDLPSSVIIIGAGPIGMEFAHIWHTYGAKVTVVEMLPRVLPLEDEQISAVVERAFKRRKVKLLTGTRVEGLEMAADGVRVRVTDDQGERASPERSERVLEAERALIAIGVQPSSKNLGLEALGVRVDRGNIVVDEYMRTNVPGIYAIGDVTGKLALAHVASAQGIVAAEAIAGVETRPLDYGAMPRCTYCQPQVASFGLTEAQAAERGHQVRIGKFFFLANGKALGLGERDGFVKIVADAVSGEILGAHLVGPEVTELLPELVLARNWELTPEEIARSVHAHPTLSEAIMEAAHGVFGKAIHA